MPGNGSLSLDPRLSMIARLVGPCESCADIGCDHGRLGAFLIQSGQCDRVVLTDISEPSLAKARALTEHLGLVERVDFAVADGIPRWERPPRAVVIAGMGGATICDILHEGRERLGGARLILQPNVAAPQLRGALSHLGYAVTAERIAQDGRRCYVIIAAESGASEYGPRERVVGPVLLRDMPKELIPYARFRLRVTEKALKGAVRGADAAQQRALSEELSIWREVCAWLQR